MHTSFAYKVISGPFFWTLVVVFPSLIFRKTWKHMLFLFSVSENTGKATNVPRRTVCARVPMFIKVFISFMTLYSAHDWTQQLKHLVVLMISLKVKYWLFFCFYLDPEVLSLLPHLGDVKAASPAVFSELEEFIQQNWIMTSQLSLGLNLVPMLPIVWIALHPVYPFFKESCWQIKIIVCFVQGSKSTY